MKVALLGSGKVAQHIGEGLKNAGHLILQVYSRQKEHADRLALQLDSDSCDSLDALKHDAEAYIFMLKDDVLTDIARKIHFPHAVCLHTSGTLGLDVFPSGAKAAVLYPLQTFSSEVDLDLSVVPFFIEGTSNRARSVANLLAQSLSTKVYTASTERRRRLHLAATFASNFINHLLTISKELAELEGFDFSILYPLINETNKKAMLLSPVKAQTGPAIRGDQKVLKAHEELLVNRPVLLEVYQALSKSIQETYAGNA